MVRTSTGTPSVAKLPNLAVLPEYSLATTGTKAGGARSADPLRLGERPCSDVRSNRPPRGRPRHRLVPANQALANGSPKVWRHWSSRLALMSVLC